MPSSLSRMLILPCCAETPQKPLKQGFPKTRSRFATTAVYHRAGRFRGDWHMAERAARGSPDPATWRLDIPVARYSWRDDGEMLGRYTHARTALEQMRHEPANEIGDITAA